MPRLSGPEYEALVQDLVDSILRNPTMAHYKRGVGARNRIRGASGYPHQIDLSLEDERRLFLLELKHYTSPVGVAELLVLGARVRDIAAAFPGKSVAASLVSKKHPSRNVPGLAAFFGVKVEVVESLHSYGLSFASQHFFGVCEPVHLTDSASSELANPR